MIGAELVVLEVSAGDLVVVIPAGIAAILVGALAYRLKKIDTQRKRVHEAHRRQADESSRTPRAP